MKFKNNYKLVLLLLISVGTATLITNQSAVSTKATTINNNGTSMSNIEEKAAKFIEHVDSLSSKSNVLQDSKIGLKVSKIKFNKEQRVDDNLWKIGRYSLENDSYTVQTDENGSPITYIKKSKVTNDELYNKKHFVKASLDSVNSNDITSVANEAVADLKDNNTVFARTKNLDNGYIEYSWNRVASGYKFQSDFMMVVMDPSDNSVVSISKRFASNMPQSLDVVYSKADAERIAKNFFKSKTNFKINKASNIKLEIVNVNSKFNVHSQVSFNKETRLAYIITYNTNPPTDEFVDVYVDAKTGKIVGGNQSH